MDRDAERTAYSRALTYLNYKGSAKWAAYASAAATAVLYVALLMLLGLFADLMVHRGQLPTFRELSASAQGDLLAGWWDSSAEERKEHLRGQRLSEEKAAELAGAEELTARDRNQVGEALWRPRLLALLEEKVSPAAADSVRGREDEPAHGVLGLVARRAAQERFFAPVIAWLASWNSWWMWDSAGVFSPYLVGLFVLAVALAALRAGLTVLNHEMAARASIEAATRLRRSAYHHTFRLGTLAFRALGPSEAVTVFTRHVEAVHDALYLRLTSGVRDPALFVLLLLFALAVHPGLALAFLLFALLVWFAGGQVATYFRRQSRQATHQASERLALIRESLMMMRLVKVYMMELFNQSRVERLLAKHASDQQKRYRGEAFYLPVLVLLGLLATFLLLYAAGVIVLRGLVGVPSVIVMTAALISLYWPLERWLAGRRVMKRGREAAVQLYRFLDRRGEVGQVVGAEFLPALEKGIEFDNVTLREPGSGRLLVQGISLRLKAGERIGLVGADDLEKHAFVYLIARLLDPTAGEIRIDDHNLRWVTLDSLRDKIAMVMLHNLVFHDTVANNIGCGDAAYTLPKVIDAAKQARAHQFIQKLPRGYETVIGELGHSLSLSQKYRIALARAILRDPSLIIIEEPEEALDEETKDLLDDALARFLPGRTVIFLPHRVSTIRSCDRILLIHNGKVEAAGIHKELLSQNRLYRHLHYLEFNEMAEIV